MTTNELWDFLEQQCGPAPAVKPEGVFDIFTGEKLVGGVALPEKEATE